MAFPFLQTVTGQSILIIHLLFEASIQGNQRARARLWTMHTLVGPHLVSEFELHKIFVSTSCNFYRTSKNRQGIWAHWVPDSQNLWHLKLWIQFCRSSNRSIGQLVLWPPYSLKLEAHFFNFISSTSSQIVIPHISHLWKSKPTTSVKQAPAWPSKGGHPLPMDSYFCSAWANTISSISLRNQIGCHVAI